MDLRYLSQEWSTYIERPLHATVEGVESGLVFALVVFNTVGGCLILECTISVFGLTQKLNLLFEILICCSYLANVPLLGFSSIEVNYAFVFY